MDIFGSRCSSKKAAGLEMTNEELASFGSQSRVATYEILFRKSEKYVYMTKRDLEMTNEKLTSSGSVAKFIRSRCIFQ